MKIKTYSLRTGASCIILVLSLFALSCSDILTEDPVSLATAEGHYRTGAGIRDGLRAAYTPLRAYYADQVPFFLTVVGTDIYTNGFGGTRNFPSFNTYDQNLLGTDPFFTTLWDNFYVGINQCNTVVERASKLAITEMSDAEKSIAIGEARFLRALYYFELVRQFGEVHFSLEETIGVQTEAFRTPVQTIYDEGIVPDLQFALQNLPDVATDYGRATKPAAEALLSRVFLTLGNWTEAGRLASSVIDNYSFSLVKPYADLWKLENDINDEFIWTVQYTDDPLTNGPGNRAFLFWVWDYTRNPAMVRDLENGRPFQRFMPTNYFLKMWDPISDARWAQTFKTVFIANTSGEINGQQVNPGDTAIKIVTYPVDDQIQEKAPYWYIDFNDEDVAAQDSPLEIGGDNRRLFPVLNKYHDALRSSVNSTDGRRDFHVIRLGEMYLIAAESAFRQGDKAAAADYMNTLRERALIPGKEEAMFVAPEDVDLDFILDERARELCGEMHRWYDLKRTGLLLERTRLYNTDAAPNIKEMHLVRPIPQTQIDRVSNPGDFPQNQGY